MKRLQPLKDVSLALNAGQLDLRSPSGRTAEGAFRLIVNAIGDSRGQLRRLGGFRRLAISEPMEEMTFAVISDYGSANSNEAAVAALVATWKPDFIVTAGDNVYDAAASLTVDSTLIKVDSTAYSADQTNSVVEANEAFSASVTQYYGSYVSSNNFFPAIGNHDVDYDGTGAWFRSKFPSLFQNNKNYYTFQKGDIGFFILSSGYRTNGTVFEPDGNTSNSAQKTWLQGALASSTARLKVVVFHHPPYSSTSNYEFAALRWDFAGMGADIVINGHAHNYQRWTNQPIPYIVAGIGGASLYNFDLSTANSVVDNPPRFGALRCTVRGHELKIDAIVVGGSVVDSITLCDSIQNEDLHDQLPDFPIPSSISVSPPKVAVISPVAFATASATISVSITTIAVTAPTAVAENLNAAYIDMPTVSVIAPTGIFENIGITYVDMPTVTVVAPTATAQAS
jgi:tartrate-resistant acid phosphatase type 5